jgi:hypothetical protein
LEAESDKKNIVRRKKFRAESVNDCGLITHVRPGASHVRLGIDGTGWSFGRNDGRNGKLIGADFHLFQKKNPKINLFETLWPRFRLNLDEMA